MLNANDELGVSRYGEMDNNNVRPEVGELDNDTL